MPFRKSARSIVAFAFLALALIAPANSDAGSVNEFDIAIRAGSVERHFKTIRVTQGDRVVLRWSSDAIWTVHLEGYDISVQVDAERPSSIEFDALVTGRFPIHAHPNRGHGGTASRSQRHGALAHLEVHPK